MYIGCHVILEHLCSYVGCTFIKGRSIVSHTNKLLLKLGTNHTLQRIHVVVIGIKPEPQEVFSAQSFITTHFSTVLLDTACFFINGRTGQQWWLFLFSCMSEHSYIAQEELDPFLDLHKRTPGTTYGTMTSIRLGTKGNKPAATCNVEVEEKDNSCQSAETTKVRSAVQNTSFIQTTFACLLLTYSILLVLWILLLIYAYLYSAQHVRIAFILLCSNMYVASLICLLLWTKSNTCFHQRLARMQNIPVLIGTCSCTLWESSTCN